MKNGPDYRSFRCKAQCGLSIQWGVGKTRSGKYKALSAGKMKYGRSPVPSDFAPFEILDSVLGKGHEFDSIDEAERYVRSL